MENTYSGSKSEFNMGLSMLERINNILNVIAEFTLAKDFPSWRDALITLNEEVAYLYDDEENEEINKLFREVSPLISKCAPKFNFGSSRPQIQISGEEYNNLFIKLTTIGRKIRFGLNKRNMLLKKSRDPSKAIAEMS